jgi:RNA recognition motif-containing protein
MNEAKDRDAESYNRLFILGGKGCSEETFRKEFGKFGHITDIYIMKDKGSGEDRGIVYITFDKISEAALALEEMNGQTIPGNPKPLKVNALFSIFS